MTEYERADRRIWELQVAAMKHRSKIGYLRAMKNELEASEGEWLLTHEDMSEWHWCPPICVDDKLQHIYTDKRKALKDINELIAFIQECSEWNAMAIADCKAYIAELRSIDGGQ